MDVAVDASRIPDIAINASKTLDVVIDVLRIFDAELLAHCVTKVA